MSLNTIAIKCIKKYQQNKEIIGSGRCKHYPTCSNYAIGCYQKFNFIKASFLSLFRIIRCNPLTKKCYDPVPLNRKEKKLRKEKLEKLKAFIPYLKSINKLYPKMSVYDYIIFIYEGTFGPFFLKDKCQSSCELNINCSNTTTESKYVAISDTYVRVYNPCLSKQELTEYFNFINSLNMTDELIQEFHYKLYLFKQLVKRKEINFDYKETYNLIEQYLINGIRYLTSSNFLDQNYILKKRKLS